MSFFDTKEEVINIELTSYGKILLSKGILKPVYYSFHDEDILYNAEFGGITELPSLAEVRIQEETPHLKPFYSFSSPEVNLQKAINQENFIETINNLASYKVDYFDNSIGDSTVSNLYLPSWKIKSLSVDFTSVQQTFGDNLKIPQLDCVLTSSIYKTTETKLQANDNLNSLVSFDNTLYTNDGFVYITEYDTLVLKIEEDNVDADINKFDIEIYKVETDVNNIETYTLMKFVKNIEYVDNDNILQSIKTNYNNLVYDNTYVDKYLDITFDKNIDTKIVCKHILKTTEDQDQIFDTINLCNNIVKKYTTNDLYKIITDNATGKNC